jgi:excisionase family DNA binding protein
METKYTHDHPAAHGWLTLAQAAAYLAKPRSWMYDNYKKLEIPHSYVGRQPRFTTEQLDKWLHLRMQHRLDYVSLR